MEQNKKPCYKSDGTRETGAKIIKALEAIGGSNTNGFKGDDKNAYYFVASDSHIAASGSIFLGYELKELPEEIVSFIPKICYKGDGTRETGNKIIKALQDLGGSNSGWLEGSLGMYYYIDERLRISGSGNPPKGYTKAFFHTNEAKDVSNKPLTEKDMIEGEVYLIRQEDALFLVDKNRNYIYMKRETFSRPFTHYGSEIIELASESNKKWLQACVKAGKYMPIEALQKPMFKKGEYIVLIEVLPEDAYKPNHCYKQSVDYHYLMSCLDSKGSVTNGWNFINHDEPSKWRYATSEEAVYYEKIGKPYDVIRFSIFHNYQKDGGDIAVNTLDGIYTIHANGEWAEIIQEAPKMETKWQIGDWVEIIRSDYSTYKVGGIHQITYKYENIIRLSHSSGADLDFHKNECKWLGNSIVSRINIWETTENLPSLPTRVVKDYSKSIVLVELISKSKSKLLNTGVYSHESTKINILKKK